MKKLTLIILAVAIAFSFSACSIDSSKAPFIPGGNQESADSIPTGEIPKKLLTFDDSYYDPVEDSLPVQTFSYKTQNGTTKNAVVYLPPNYDESSQYDILYLLGGDKSAETVFFSETDGQSLFKNALDNLITNGDIKPTIVVSLSFYPDNNRGIDENNIYYLLDNFTTELGTSIIPAVEGEYATYAQGTSNEELVASREHRAFGGFSWGSNATWVIMTKCLEYFKYYLPMSGGSINDYVPSYTGDVPQMLRERLEKGDFTKDDYFIFATVGEIDYTNEDVTAFIDYLKEDENSDLYVFTDTNKFNGNITFQVMKDAHHEYQYAHKYIYNAIRLFWE